jgi:hypothetical protein
MDAVEELDFVVKGIVRNGQVVTETPLVVPDGTHVTIRPTEDGGDSTEGGEPVRLTAEQIRWFREHTERLRARAAVGRDDPRAA